ncbi:MAG: tetratricopeptide repeat protein [Blastocatellia bacterium]|nr:tetratricopeptide repeat protein [Blastocatellia bacterium]
MSRQKPQLSLRVANCYFSQRLAATVNARAGYVKATYYEKAVQCLNLALNLNANNAEIYNELGLALLGKNEKKQQSKLSSSYKLIPT